MRPRVPSTVVAVLAVLAACGPPAASATRSPPPSVRWAEIPPPPNGEAAAADGAQWIEILRSDGRRQVAAVFRPTWQGEGPLPVVVYLGAEGGISQPMLAWAPQLADAGFLTVAGCWAHTPPLSPLVGDVRCPPGPVLDKGHLEALVAAARALPGARAEAVGLLGLTAGANQALYAATAGVGVQAVVADSGAPPVALADRPMHTPVLLLAGEQDMAPNRRYPDGLRQQGTPPEEGYYPRGRHVVTLDPNLDATRRAIDFFRRHL
jgi:dienelactone hydrolase